MRSAGRSETLAALRVAVAFLILVSEELRQASRFAVLDRDLLRPPLGMELVARWLPPSDALIAVAQGLLVLALLAGLVGFWSRLSMGIAAFLAIYVLGVPQLWGGTVHSHHLVWLAALLAASPCGDSWSVDAFRAAKRGAPIRRSRLAYALPLVFAWMLLGAVYFFPGVWKLRESGIDWILSDNLRNRMYEKWMVRGGAIPALRPDRFPWLLQAGAAAVVLLELAFPLLVLGSRRTREVAATAALLFHGLSAVFFHIHFPSLWITFVMFFDVRHWARSVRWHVNRLLGADPAAAIRVEARRRLHPRHDLVPVSLTGVALLAGAIGFGVSGVRHGWPFACYPTFQWVAEQEVVVLRVVGLRADGREVEIQRGGGTGQDAQRWWAITSSLASGGDETRLRAFARLVARRSEVRAERYRALHLERAWVSVLPGEGQAAPRHRDVIHVLPLEHLESRGAQRGDI